LSAEEAQRFDRGSNFWVKVPQIGLKLHHRHLKMRTDGSQPLEHHHNKKVKIGEGKIK